MGKRKYYFCIAGMICTLFIGAYIALHVGSIKLPISTAYNIFIDSLSKSDKESEEKVNEQQEEKKQSESEKNYTETQKAIIFELRLPRIIAAILCGAALAVSGAAYQSMFVNPLVSPSLLGVLAGAAFGASLGMVLSQELIAAQIGATVFGIIAVMFSLFLARFFPGNRLIMTIMGGVISSTLFTALLSVVKFVADTQNQLPAIVYWLMGGFSSVTINTLIFCSPILIICILIVIVSAGYLNVLSLGDEEALALGINVNLVRNTLIFVTTLCSALTVSIGGMIGWVGMMIPHISRMIVGHDNRKMVLFSAILGAIYLLIVDTLCRSSLDTEIPIGIVTSIIGIPFFIFTVIHAKNRWN